MLAEDELCRLAASLMLLVVPRQNGKNVVLEVVELYCFFVVGMQYLLHTAHLQETAVDYMRRVWSVICEHEDLARLCKPVWGKGDEAIMRVDTGARIKFRSRSKKVGRGGSPQMVVFDEALYLKNEHLAALLPGLSANTMGEDRPVLVYASSAPREESEVLHQVRSSVRAGRMPSAWYAEWGCEMGVDASDRDMWYASNPGMGIRISEQWVAENELAVMTTEDFLTERLGVVLPQERGGGVIPEEYWVACGQAGSVWPTGGHVALAVSPNSRSASIGYAVALPDGTVGVEVARYDAGVAWVPLACQRACADTGRPMIVDPRSASVSVVQALREANVPMLEIGATEFIEACGAFQSDVLGRRMLHIDQPILNIAATSAATRPVGEAWVFTARRSEVDISPLLAVTLAARGARAGRIATHVQTYTPRRLR
jgi:hypothetical protein